MVRQFDEKQRWWERDFPKEAARRVEPKAEMQVSQGALGGLAATARLREAREQAKAVPMPAPSFAPMPVAPAAAGALSRACNVRRHRLGARSRHGQSQRQIRRGGALLHHRAASPGCPMRLHERLQDAGKDDLYRVYLDERAAWLSSSSFYMDAAGVFLDRGLPELGLRVLSNLAEMNLENRQLLRLYAYRLVQAPPQRPGRAGVRTHQRAGAQRAAIVARPGPGAGREAASRSVPSMPCGKWCHSPGTGALPAST
jgi:Ca-activated chloride channel family protein